ncbi:hypothetical protein DCCM_2464 [Desulfocucumis palustris]|uniref:Uncharacterized protein n=2 Tax=Desulfocucumis palustris TaxID=1898651 RepID=A0A2L2XCE4_9FIRM|nr:hypothetical protein DCCM_2464 [Desulfocucumis palustris]
MPGPEDNYGYPPEVRVIELGKKGKPIKLEITCCEPDCENKRIVKVQDYFQVKRCRDCQSKYFSEHRRELAKFSRQRKKAEKAAAANELNQG